MSADMTESLFEDYGSVIFVAGHPANGQPAGITCSDDSGGNAH